MAIHNEIGKIGEDIASNFLRQKGHKVICRNYWKPYGEIDIVSCENDKFHFVEVKTVSYETNSQEYRNISTSEVDTDTNINTKEGKTPLWTSEVHRGKNDSLKKKAGGGVPHGTYRPEDNLHPKKLQRLSRVIQSYLISHETVSNWQFDVIAVYLDTKNKKAKVKWLKDIIIST